MAERSKLRLKTPSVKHMDSVRYRHSKLADRKRDPDLYDRCRTLWWNRADIREARARNIRFSFGDQLGDYINVNGEVMTERQYLIRHGMTPIQSNQIKNKLNTIIGLWVKGRDEPFARARDRSEQQYGEVVNAGLQANCDKNKFALLGMSWLMDLVLGGASFGKARWARSGERNDALADYCNFNCMLWDSAGDDPRFKDLVLIGEIYEMSFVQLVAALAKSPADYATLEDIYKVEADPFKETDGIMSNEQRSLGNLDFDHPTDSTKCRVLEVWTKESKPIYHVYDPNYGDEYIMDADDTERIKEIRAINAQRSEECRAMGVPRDRWPLIEWEDSWDMYEYWYCRIMAPDATILWEGESPYAGQDHPYAISAIPMVNGTVSGYISDAIDHQRGINRAIILQDWLIRVQAKGVWMVPKDIVPRDMTYQEFAEHWTSIDGMIFYTPKAGVPKPECFHGQAVQFDAAKLIEQYQRMMEASTAVNGAIQGKTPLSGTSGTMYAQMTANSSTPSASLMENFRYFNETMARKLGKILLKFYTVDDWSKIVSYAASLFGNQNLKLNRIADLEYDFAIKQGTETLERRQAANEWMTNAAINGLISSDEMLRYGDFEFADEILQSREARQAEMQAAQGQQTPLGPLPQSGAQTTE